MSSTPGKRDEHVGKDKKWPKRTQDEKQAVQERTFTRWINMHLKKCDPPLQSNNLFTDIQDGKILMALIEELSGSNMLDRFRPFPHHIFRLNNISKVLNFLEDRNVSLINIDANDIADGNPSAILKLIWNIIVYYQIKQVTGSLEKYPSTFSLLSYPCGVDCLGHSSPVSPGEDIFGSLPSKGKRSSQNLKYRSTALKTLLSWAKNCTAKYGIEIYDFGKSWRSGLAFVALVKFFCPEFVDMRKALLSEPQQNMETAFTAAHEWLGISPLLDPDDVAVHSPDEQSVITYVSQFLECCPGHDEDGASTDSSRGTPVSIERWDRTWTDSVNSQSTISTEALKGLHNPFDTSQFRTADQVLISESLSVGLSTISETLLPMKSSSWSNGQSFSDSTGGQCCDSLTWANSFIASLEDDEKDSGVSKKAVSAMSMLDSDEEDAFSYILELDHKKAGLDSNIDSESNTIMDAQLFEFDLNVANTLESQRSEGTCNLCETQNHLSPKDGFVRSDSCKSTDENVLDQVLPSKDISVTQNISEEKSSLASDMRNQTGVDDIEMTATSSSDEHLNLDCLFKMKKRILSDVSILTHSIDDAIVKVKNGLNEDKLREDLCLGAVKDSQLNNERYEQSGVLDRSVPDRITGEPVVPYTQRKEAVELHVLLFLWMIAYCILLYPHLDVFSLLNPN